MGSDQHNLESAAGKRTALLLKNADIVRRVSRRQMGNAMHES
jgi:hypothetical protein